MVKAVSLEALAAPSALDPYVALPPRPYRPIRRAGQRLCGPVIAMAPTKSASRTGLAK